MDIQPLDIDGAYVITPDQQHDEGGGFLANYRGDLLATHLGYQPHVTQTNIATSSRGALRGIHYAPMLPSQAKFVTALTGAILDFIVDLRVGSPTFGQWESIRLDATGRRGVYLTEGLGHALLALEQHTTTHFLCSTADTPVQELAINPLDPAIGLPVPQIPTPMMSPHDKEAPTLAQAQASGLLPCYQECTQYLDQLRGLPGIPRLWNVRAPALEVIS